MKHEILTGDCLNLMRQMPDNSVDLVFCSPPYEDARTYGIDFRLKGQDWVDWSVARYLECARVCRGLVCWVVEGKTKQFRYSATPILLMADLHRAGVKLRKPPLYRRDGIPGSGGPDWLANKYEFLVSSSKGKLPWSDNLACGHKPKYGAGGAPSHRKQNGERVNKEFVTPETDERNRLGSHRPRRRARLEAGIPYVPPEKSNPGNIIDCGAVGGANMGHALCHENEAPFPFDLAAFFIRSFCPLGGIAL